MQKGFWIGGVLIFISLNCIGQSGVNEPADIKTSVNFGGSTNIPPGSGTLIYSIPLFNIEAHGIQLPITLTYTGDGLKTSEKASWIGEGWELSYGGKIIRDQNGLPDDVNIYDEGKPKAVGYLNAGPESFVGDEYAWSNNLTYEKIAQGLVDVDPDIFHFSSNNGFRGKFSIRRNGNIIPLDVSVINNYECVDFEQNISDFKFGSNSAGNIKMFELSDINGLKYSFRTNGKIKVPEHGDRTGLSYTVDWSLEEIKNELNESLFLFEYMPNEFTREIKDHSVWRSISTHLGANSTNSTQQVPNSEYSEYYIKKIKFPTGYISFIMDEIQERIDLPGHYRLKQIEYYDLDDNLIEKVVLNHQYLGENIHSTIICQRLFLSEISRYKGSNEVPFDSMALNYNEAINFPRNNSSDFDFWGYLNGESNNTLDYYLSLNLLSSPIFQANQHVPISLFKQFAGNANRLPSETYTKAGILESINFANGKSISFNYELNDYSKVFDNGNYYDVYREYELENVNEPGSYTNQNGDEFWNDEILVSNLTQYPQWVDVKYNRNDGCINQMMILDYFGPGQHYEVQYEIVDNVPTYVDKWVKIFITPNTQIKYAPVDPDGPFAVCPIPIGSTSSPNVQIRYHDYSDTEESRNMKEAGGLRISKIITDDNNGNRHAEMYDYSILQETVKYSSGIMIEEPTKIYKSGEVVNWGTHQIFSQRASKGLTENSLKNNVIYTNIEKYTCKVGMDDNCLPSTNSKFEIGRTKSYFKINPASEALSYEYPLVNSTKNSSRRILLDSVQIYDASGDLISSVGNEYNYKEYFEEEIEGRIIVPYEYKHKEEYKVTLSKYRSFFYRNRPEINQISKVNSRDYDGGVLVESISNKTYGSNNLFRNIVISETTILHNGDEVKTLNNYSGMVDFHNISPNGTNAIAIKNLQLQNRLLEPIEQIIYYKKSNESSFYPIKREIFLYRTLANGKVVLDKLINRKIINPITEVHNLINITTNGEFNYTYDPNTDDFLMTTKYNLNYNPVEFKNNKDLINSIILDDQYKVVSQIKNGKLSTSRYTSFEDPTHHGGWNPIPANIVDASEADYAITGDKYYNLQSGSFNSGTGDNRFPAGKYLLCYWSKGNVAVYYNNSPITTKHSSYSKGDWTYNEKIIEWTTSDNYITMSAASNPDVFIDELRLHEIDATMETRGYYPDGKIKYKASATGDVITYEYDDKGRLEWVLDRERHVIEHHQYEEKDIADENSFHKHTTFGAKVEGLTKTNIVTITNLKKSKRTEFLDGFGRFRQSVDHKVSYLGGKSDMITFADYDDFGRSLIKHLPYFDELPANQGYIQNVQNQQKQYYLNLNDPNEQNTDPYIKTEVESSPLQRPVKIGGVGEELQPGNGHSTEIEYGWNNTGDNIRKWNYDPATIHASAPTIYGDNELRKKTITDPDGKTISTFTDARGRQVATTVEAKVRLDGDGRAYSGHGVGAGSLITKKLTSYSVFDDFGRVVFEIPAKAVEELAISGNYTTQAIIQGELITSYAYDQKGRLDQKTLPGNGGQYFVYDQLDRLIMNQDEQQKEDDKWSFVKYDTRGRIVLKGVTESTENHTNHKSNAASHLASNGEIIKGEVILPNGGSGSLMGYSNTTYPDFVTLSQLTNVYYFDNYDFDLQEFNFVPFNDISSPLEVTRGLPTGSKTRVLNSDGTLGGWLTTVSYYDDKKRPIQAFTQNHLGGWDRIDTYYNEYGQVEKTVQHHRYKNHSDEHVLSTRFEYYNFSGKLRKIYCKINDDPEITISTRDYDEKGQLKKLKLHREAGVANYLQNIDYRYNAQGNLTHINNTALIVDAFNEDDDDVFGQELTYFNESPEYYIPGGPPSPDDPHAITPQYGGNISSMMWNAKAPDEDGTTLKRHAYVYRYDDLGNLTNALYASDKPSTPGEFNESKNYFNEEIGYDLGGNIKRLKRNRETDPVNYPNPSTMDDLHFTYQNNGYLPIKIDDTGEKTHAPQRKHFIDNANVENEYIYDKTGRLTEDKNRKINISYNSMGLPRHINHQPSAFSIAYMYDAAGNKLQKFREDSHICPPNELCVDPDPYAIDYIGNFVYERGELKMIYHPEGVLRPTPKSADNETEFVYDYFIKDYLGNVRVVLTEEDANYSEKFLATMEEVHRQIERDNFDNIDETVQDLPLGYPVNGSVELNKKIASLSAANGTQIGPSMVLPVRRGDKVSLRTEYFYSEDAPGSTYDNVNMFINEILLALAASGSGILRLTEGQLIDLAVGDPRYTDALIPFLSSNFDTTDVSKPHAYLVWMLYDNDMKLIVEGSGAKRVTDPNALKELLEEDIPVIENGYLHAYVSNGGIEATSFDNFLVTYMRGKTRQINHYYPYGLSIAGLGGDYDEYLNKYTSKELQTGEFDPAVSTGLEMFDFGSRFYDPQIGRWHTPDPAEQFANPYLAMGNNPVMYVDPDGEWILTASIIAISAISGGIRAKRQGGDVVDGVMRGLMIGGATAMIGPIGGGGLPFVADIGIATAQGAAIGAMDAHLWNNDVGKSALWGGAAAAMTFTLTSPQLKNALKGKKFKTNQNVFKDFSAGKHTKSGGAWQQDALDYFGFEGKYLSNFDDYFSSDDYAVTVGGLDMNLPSNTKLGDIYYSDRVFDPKNYDWLNFNYDHEMFHRAEVLQGHIPKEWRHQYSGEFRAYRHNIDNLGHYPNFSIESFNKASLVDQIDRYGGMVNLYHSSMYKQYMRMTEYIIPLRW